MSRLEGMQVKINAVLRHKEPEIKPRAYEVSDVITLSDAEYRNLQDELLKDREYLKGRTGQDTCVLLLSETDDDGILVDTQGYDYPRYSAFVPKAKVIVNSFVQTIANYAVSEGMQNSEGGMWGVSNDELYYHFGADVKKDNAFGKMLTKELNRRCEIESVELVDDGIEYEVKREYCENLKEEEYEDKEESTNTLTAEGLAEQAEYATNAPKCCSEKERALNMLGMLGSNIADEDIYHDESEHDERTEKGHSLEMNMQ